MEFEVGSIVEGKVKSIVNFGAFVELECGKSGIVHISEISDTFVKNIKDHLEEGESVKVKIISMDAKGKLGLSIKRAQERKKLEVKALSDNTYKKNNIGNKFKKIVSSKAGLDRFEDMMAKFKQISDEKISSFTEKTKRRGNGRKSSHRNDM